MMQNRLTGTLAMTLALSLALALALACGGGAKEDGGPSDEAAEAAAPAVSPDSAATITGTVAFEGTAPAPVPIDMSEEPTCDDKHPGGATSPVAVVTDGMLGNVYVYVKDGLGDRAFPTPTEGVTIDQNGCLYAPHVLAVQTGQPLVIKNSDGILHNINTSPTANRGFNVSQPVEMETEKEFSTAEVMIPVKCDVHGWMAAYIGVQEHPYAAVTGTDGTFTLANLPPGTYTLEAWHELYGTQTATVTVGAKETGTASFTFTAAAAGAHVPLGEPLVLHTR